MSGRIGRLEDIVSDIMGDRYEENDENDYFPGDSQTGYTRKPKKKSVLPKFDHLETY